MGGLPRLQSIVDLISSEIDANGQEFDGYDWAVLPLQDWAEKAEVSLPHFKRLIAKPPVDRLIMQVEGRVATILRIGEADANLPTRVARKMAKAFEIKTGKRPSRRDFGCLKGLASILPQGFQVDIFREVIDSWSSYMVAVDLEIHFQISEGSQEHQKRYYKFPSIPVIRRFPQQALDTWQMNLQEQGKWPPTGWENK